METIISYGIFISIVVFLNILDYKKYKTILNPFFFLSIPFSIISLCCILLNNTIQFIAFFPLSLNLWSLGLILFWIGGFISSVLSSNFLMSNSLIEESSQNTLKNMRLINTLFFTCILISLLLILKNGGSDSFASKEMGEAIGQGGIAGRISNILILAVPFYFASNFPRLIKYSIIIILFICITAIGSKTWLTYSLLAGIVVIILGRKKINLKFTLITFILLFGTFSIYYKLNTNIEDNDHFIKFILRHFYFYVTSGVLPLSEIIRNDINFAPGGIYHPFIILVLYWLNPSSVSFHSSRWITTDTLLGTQSNVYTFFGTLYLGGWPYDFIIYSILSGLISYLYLYLYKIKKNIFYTIPYSFTLAILFFGWYNWGFSLLRIWEIYIYSFMLYVISQKKIRLFKPSSCLKNNQE